jgi:hypothetical protein
MQMLATIGLDIANDGWEGEQHVMQSRSIQRSRQPTGATAFSNAGF